MGSYQHLIQNTYNKTILPWLYTPKDPKEGFLKVLHIYILEYILTLEYMCLVDTRVICIYYYFADKGPYSQSCGFSSSHVWM